MRAYVQEETYAQSRRKKRPTGTSIPPQHIPVPHGPTAFYALEVLEHRPSEARALAHLELRSNGWLVAGDKPNIFSKLSAQLLYRSLYRGRLRIRRPSKSCVVTPRVRVVGLCKKGSLFWARRSLRVRQAHGAASPPRALQCPHVSKGCLCKRCCPCT